MSRHKHDADRLQMRVLKKREKKIGIQAAAHDRRINKIPNERTC